MGSDSDWNVMQHTASVLEEFKVPYEARVVSAHRTPDEMYRYAESAASRGLQLVIAGQQFEGLDLDEFIADRVANPDSLVQWERQFTGPDDKVFLRNVLFDASLAVSSTNIELQGPPQVMASSAYD